MVGKVNLTRYKLGFNGQIIYLYFWVAFLIKPNFNI